ncbi:hypothetical protein [Saccharothrix deserti]|uniref:hypothetical protein n=1 Tax=Saccharothrix deserti TaxID=2593674 RepID=UPI00131C69F9|nr:hypothetical protein [Saccharothrix deserti]
MTGEHRSPGRDHADPVGQALEASAADLASNGSRQVGHRLADENVVAHLLWRQLLGVQQRG